jgi:O-antigen ligase
MTTVQDLRSTSGAPPRRPVDPYYRRAKRPPFPGVLAWRPDAVSILSVVITLLFVIPGKFVVKGLGAVATPVNVVGIILMVLWLTSLAVGGRRWSGRQPVHFLIWTYAFIYLLTYAGGFARGLYPDEASNATRSVIEMFALMGIALVAADSIQSRERLNVLLQRLVYGASFMAFAGDLEATTKFNLATHLQFPGLVTNSRLIGERLRGTGGIFRVAGTATHYIEFGVVLGMLLPLALHFAIFSPTRGRRRFNWFLTALMAAGVPFAVSRAAAVAVFVAILVLACCWTWRARVNALILAAIFLVGLKAAKPGLLGTIRALFTQAGSDPSISHRTTEYGSVFTLISQRPLFGRGAGTYIPTRYQILDNQVLLTTIESGVFGLIAFISLFIGGAALAHRVGKFSQDPETRHLGYALLAAFAVGLVTSFTFDSFSFPIFTTVIFLVLGVAGALWRLDAPARHEARARAELSSLASSPGADDEDATHQA